MMTISLGGASGLGEVMVVLPDLGWDRLDRSTTPRCLRPTRRSSRRPATPVDLDGGEIDPFVVLCARVESTPAGRAPPPPATAPREASGTTTYRSRHEKSRHDRGQEGRWDDERSTRCRQEASREYTIRGEEIGR